MILLRAILVVAALAFILGYATGPEPKQPTAPKCEADVVTSYKLKLVSLEFNHPSCRRYFT